MITWRNRMLDEKVNLYKKVGDQFEKTGESIAKFVKAYNGLLIDGMYYWIEDRRTKKIFVGKFDASYKNTNGCFDLPGNENVFGKDEFNVLSKVEIPDDIDVDRIE